MVDDVELSLGGSIAHADSSYFPGGCFYDHGNGKVYFNYGDNENTNLDKGAVCIQPDEEIVYVPSNEAVEPIDPPSNSPYVATDLDTKCDPPLIRISTFTECAFAADQGIMVDDVELSLGGSIAHADSSYFP